MVETEACGEKVHKLSKMEKPVGRVIVLAADVAITGGTGSRKLPVIPAGSDTVPGHASDLKKGNGE